MEFSSGRCAEKHATSETKRILIRKWNCNQEVISFKKLLVYCLQGRPSPHPIMHIAYYSPYFHKMYKFPNISAKCLHFFQFPQNLDFFLNLRFLACLYFDHDAFMPHTLHVLNSPGGLITSGITKHFEHRGLMGWIFGDCIC